MSSIRIACGCLILLCVAGLWGNAGQTQEVPQFIELKGHTGAVNSAVFFPDGKKVVTGGFPDGTVRIWTLE